MDDHDHQITFGVEMKFLFALEEEKLLQRYGYASQISPSTADIPTNEDLSITLWEYVTHILSRYRLGEYCPGQPRLSLDARFVRQPQDADFSVWSVTTDDTLLAYEHEERTHLDKAQAEQQLQWQVRGVELVSPILRLSDIDFVTILFERIGRVLADHESVFWPHQLRYGPHKAFVNETCGLHVHLAYENQDIPLETLKNLVIIWALFEDEIETLQPMAHHAGAGMFTSLRRRFPGENGRKLFLKAVRVCKDPDQLMTYTRPQGSIPEYSKIRLTDFSNSTAGSNVRTIEFREHEGTLDPMAIRWWILFTSGVLRFAQALADANQVFDVAGNVGITDLFDLIEFPPEGQEFYARRIVRHARAMGDNTAYWSQGSLSYDFEKATHPVECPDSEYEASLQNQFAALQGQ
ncbi:MAG: hypothetical protein M1836_003042 [Candelina mexicana]|nr:MAG: hypothetical protein M1836_003042 [Candelina mexicana]